MSEDKVRKLNIQLLENDELQRMAIETSSGDDVVMTLGKQANYMYILTVNSGLTTATLYTMTSIGLSKVLPNSILYNGSWFIFAFSMDDVPRRMVLLKTKDDVVDNFDWSDMCFPLVKQTLTLNSGDAGPTSYSIASGLTGDAIK